MGQKGGLTATDFQTVSVRGGVLARCADLFDLSVGLTRLLLGVLPAGLPGFLPDLLLLLWSFWF
jgi:hypothetical protein